MNTKLPFSVISCFIISLIRLAAQPVVFPSPNVRELDKYITHEVNLSNGLVNIEVPIYTIQMKGLSIPIKLTYHASGIKFNQKNGDAGLGWVISPNYHISRTVNGLADEFSTMPTNIVTQLTSMEAQNAVTRDNFIARFYPGSDDSNSGVPYVSPSNQLDGQYDWFNFSTPNNGGSFFITNRTSKQIITEARSSERFQYNQVSVPNSRGISDFHVYDEDGNQYYYGKKEFGSDYSIETNNNSYIGLINTAWPIRELITAQKDRLQFNYITNSVVDNSPYYQRNYYFNQFWVCDDINNRTTQNRHWEDMNSHHPSYRTYLVDEIRSDKEIVKFFRENSSGERRITEIRVSTLTGVTKKRAIFEYETKGIHTYLRKVVIRDSGNTNYETFSFLYHNENESLSFQNLIPNQWQYYKVGNPFNFYHKEFGDIYAFIGQQYNFAELISTVMIDRDDRKVPGPQSYFSLKRITYPTRGYTEFDYEPHRSVVTPTLNKDIGGIRIRNVTDFSSSDVVETGRNYRYGINENGGGVEVIPLSYLNFAQELIRVVTNLYGVLAPTNQLTLSSTILDDFALAANVGVVRYQEVSETITGKQLSNEKTVYKYNADNPYSYRAFTTGWTGQSNCTNLALYPSTKLKITSYRGALLKPRILEKTHFSWEGGSFKPIQKFEYKYIQSSQTLHEGLKVDVFASLVDGTPGTVHVHSSDIRSYFNYGTYSITVGKYLLTEEKATKYINGNPAQVAINQYTYDSSDRIKSVTVGSSVTGQQDRIHYTYVSDIFSSGSIFFSHISYPYSSLAADNHSKKILETIYTTVKSNGEFVLGSDLTEYKGYQLSNGFIVKPSATYKLKFNGLVPLTSFQRISLVNSGGVESLQKNAAYDKRESFDRYDNKGNLIQYSISGGATTSYLWAYGGNYPVAEVNNTLYSTMESVLGGASAVNSFSNLTNPTDITVQNFVAPLRTHNNMKNSLSSTYTYNLLYGIGSKTDPSGRKTLFQYDNIGRLKSILDNDGNIVETYDYQYRNQ